MWMSASNSSSSNSNSRKITTAVVRLLLLLSFTCRYYVLVQTNWILDHTEMMVPGPTAFNPSNFDQSNMPRTTRSASMNKMIPSPTDLDPSSITPRTTRSHTAFASSTIASTAARSNEIITIPSTMLPPHRRRRVFV